MQCKSPEGHQWLMKSSVALILRLATTSEEFCAHTLPGTTDSKKLSLTVSLSNMYAFYNCIFTQCISFCMDRADDNDITKYVAKNFVSLNDRCCTFLGLFNS